jgi:glycine cleavage system H protein
MTTPSDRRYSKTHEWHKLDGGIVTIGLTQFAVDELADVTFVSLPKVGQSVKPDERFGEIESVKATSDLYSGVSGTVTDVNGELAASPGIVNADPYGNGWLIKLKPSNPAEFDKLLPVGDYLKATGHE